MTYQFLLVDDESDAILESLVDRLIWTAGKLQIADFTITRVRPGAFEQQVDSLSAPSERFGLLLDHRLDQVPVDDSGTVRHYKGSSLAQEIRSRDTDSPEWTSWAYPVVLLSLQQRLDHSFRSDPTAQDLFDLALAKESVSSSAKRIVLQLTSLIDGYGTLRAHRAAGRAAFGATLFGPAAPLDQLDPRLVTRVSSAGNVPCHALAQFITRQLLERPGVLLSEAMVAARFGVDRATSQDWDRLLTMHLSPHRYDGVFADGWPRWWARSLEDWWRRTVAADRPLRLMDAEERVRKLSGATGLADLVAARAQREEYRTRFWTVCEDTGSPLDPADGVRLEEPEPEPWQEARYISLHAAISGVSDHRIHPLEQVRVDRLRE